MRVWRLESCAGTAAPHAGLRTGRSGELRPTYLNVLDCLGAAMHRRVLTRDSDFFTPTVSTNLLPQLARTL
jgi:hypothetical protein